MITFDLHDSDLHSWHADSSQCGLDQLQRSRSQVNVQGHNRKNVANMVFGYISFVMDIVL